jgi:hypothetical protein
MNYAADIMDMKSKRIKELDGQPRTQSEINRNLANANADKTERIKELESDKDDLRNSLAGTKLKSLHAQNKVMREALEKISTYGYMPVYDINGIWKTDLISSEALKQISEMEQSK